MSDTARPAYTVAANLRWFAAAYVAAFILLGFVVGLLRTVGITLPGVGLGVGVFAALAYLAGSRFAVRREWTGRDRHLLALGYVAVAVVVLAVVVALIFAIEPTSVSVAVVMPNAIGVVLAIVAVGMLFYYGMARLMLMLLARRGKPQ